MKNRLNEKLPYSKTIIFLALIALAAGVITVMMGELFLPVCAAALAALMLFERGRYKPVSISVSAAVAVFDVALALASKSNFTSLSLAAAIAAFILFFTYSRGMGKGECAFGLTAAVALFSVLSLVLSVISYAKVGSADELLEFFNAMRGEARDAFLLQIEEGIARLPAESAEVLSDMDFGALFDTALTLIPALLIIYAFIVAGITLKIFTAIAAACSEDRKEPLEWTFSTTGTVAVFYILLMILTAFVKLDGGLFSATLYNLYYIFMAVYVYLGFKYAHALLSMRRSPVLIFVLLLLALLLFSSLAFTVLSVFGLLVTFGYNRGQSASDQ